MEVEELRQVVARLAALPRDVDDGIRVDRIAAMEELKAALSAAQAVEAADLHRSARAAHKAVGLPRDKWGMGVAAQIALARRESPHAGQVHLRLANALVSLPNALARMRDGVLSERRAQIIADGISHLDELDRRAVDRDLCASAARFKGWSDRRFESEARRLADQLDARARLDRMKLAESARRVSVRPAPDGMAYLTALLPLKQAVAVKAALHKAAQWITCGPPRTSAQCEADLLVERVTGVSQADEIPVAISLVMTDRTLLGDDTHPARVPGFGSIPADLARSWVAASAKHRIWLRRLYVAPGSNELVAMDSLKRLFPRKLAEFLELRDDRCRNPFCGAPIRHHDHVVSHRDGGPTSGHNGAGLCARCNYDKEAPGFAAKVTGDERHTIELRTPTGHSYESTAPPVI